MTRDEMRRRYWLLTEAFEFHWSISKGEFFGRDRTILDLAVVYEIYIPDWHCRGLDLTKAPIDFFYVMLRKGNKVIEFEKFVAFDEALDFYFRIKENKVKNKLGVI